MISEILRGKEFRVVRTFSMSAFNDFKSAMILFADVLCNVELHEADDPTAIKKAKLWNLKK